MMRLFGRLAQLTLAIGCVLFGFTALDAQAAACPVTDGGAGDGDGVADGVITINSSTAWTPTDATAWDCSGKTIYITNSATLAFNSDTVNGYYGWLSADAVTIDVGARISANSKGCAKLSGSAEGVGPNGSNVCTASAAGAGDGDVSNSRGAGGGAYGGSGGRGNTGSTGLVGGSAHGSLTAPTFFGSSGGTAGVGTGGTGGGVVRIDVSGSFIHNGLLTANGGSGSAGTGAGGGGSGGAIYVTSGTFAGTGTFSVAGGAGGDGTSYDGGGGGGGRISIACATCSYSFDVSDFNLAGGTVVGTATAGTRGSAYVKNTGAGTETVYGYFEIEDTAYTFTEDLVFDSASTVTCDASATSPSISADSMSIVGVWSCSPSTLTSLTFTTIEGGIDIVSGTTLAATTAGSTLAMNIAVGSTSTWTSATITGGARGSFVIDDAVDIVLAGTTAITANLAWDGLSSLTMGGEYDNYRQ